MVLAVGLASATVGACSFSPTTPAPTETRVDPCAPRAGEVAVRSGGVVSLPDRQHTSAVLQLQVRDTPLTYRVGFSWATTEQSFDATTGAVLPVGDSTIYVRRVCDDVVLLTLDDQKGTTSATRS